MRRFFAIFCAMALLLSAWPALAADKLASAAAVETPPALEVLAAPTLSAAETPVPLAVQDPAMDTAGVTPEPVKKPILEITDPPPPKPVTQNELLEPQLKAGELGNTAGRRKVPLKLLDAVRIGMTRNINTKKQILNRATQILDLQLAERIFEPNIYLEGNYNYSAGTNTDSRGLGFRVTNQLPTAGELSFQWLPTNQWDRETNTDSYSTGLSFTLTQPLLRGAGITVGTSSVVTARFTEESNVQSFRLHLMGQITSIQSAYWNLLLALQNRLSAVRSLQESREVLRRNKQLIEAGRKAKSDLVSAEQEVARNQVSVLDQEFSVVQANRTLVNLLDLKDDVAILPMEGFVYRQVKVDYDQLSKIALKKNPALLQAQINVKQAELNLKLAKSQALDQLNLTVSTSKTGEADNLGDSMRDSLSVGEGWQAGVALSVPLGLPRDRLKRNVTVAERSLEQAHLDLKQARRSLLQEVRDGVNDINRSMRQIRLAQLSRELAGQKYDVEKIRLDLGRSTNFQVLSYQRDLTSARDSEYQAIATYLINLARLETVCGVTLETWNVQVDEPEPPNIPSLGLDHLRQPKAITTK